MHSLEKELSSRYMTCMRLAGHFSSSFPVETPLTTRIEEKRRVAQSQNRDQTYRDIHVHIIP